MKTITHFLLISVLLVSAWALTNPRTDLITLSQDNTYTFTNLKDDDTYDGWEGINGEEHMHSIAEFPEEESLEHAKVPKAYDDLDETELLSILLQILNDSSYHKEIASYLEKFSNKRLKTKGGYIDLFDLLIFGSLKSKRLYSAEEESNEEGMLHTMVEMKTDWAMRDEENIEDYSVDDQAFIDLIMSKKELDGEFIIEMVLSLMKKRGINDVDNEEEEEAFDQKDEVAVVVVNNGELAVADYEVPQHLRPKAKRGLDQVFGVAFDF